MADLLEPDPDRVAWSVSGTEVVLLDLDTSTYLSLNDSAAELWQKLVDGATRSDLVDHLTGSYDVSPETAGTDTDDLLATLTARGYLRASAA